MYSFKNKVALITGSIRGIGSSIAKKFAFSGADVVINDKKVTGSAKIKKEIICKEIQEMGRQAFFVEADISQKESVKKLFAEMNKKYDRLDFLILNAAQTPFKPIERLLERELRQLVETNYMGNIFCIQEALPFLEKTEGKIVFISSLGSRFYFPEYPLGSMKAAMESIVRDCAENFKNKKISVNGVCGGIVKTDAYKVMRLYWEDIDRLPNDLFTEPDEIADAVLFLCSPASRGIHGQIIVVDRGLSNTLYRPIGKK